MAKLKDMMTAGSNPEQEQERKVFKIGYKNLSTGLKLAVWVLYIVGIFYSIIFLAGIIQGIIGG